MDLDLVETHLDDTMRNVLQQLHGKQLLEEEVRRGAALTTSALCARSA